MLTLGPIEVYIGPRLYRPRVNNSDDEYCSTQQYKHTQKERDRKRETERETERQTDRDRVREN